MIRLFVAIPLPERVRADLAALACGLPGAQWTATDNYHLTLRFIGEVEESLYPDIAGSLASIRAEDFAFRLAGLDYFGDRRRPRILYARVEAPDALAQLQKRIENVLVRGGLVPEGRRYHPHVTLARLKDTPFERLGRFLEAFGAFAAGPVQARRFALLSSHLSSSGALYQEEVDYPLLPHHG